MPLMTALNRRIEWHAGPDCVKRHSPLYYGVKIHSPLYYGVKRHSPMYYGIHTDVCPSVSTPFGIEWWAECSFVAQGS
jgi:hypothetical protein